MGLATALLVLYAVLSLTLPFALRGDRTLATFLAYVALTLAAILTSTLRLRRWAGVG